MKKKLVIIFSRELTLKLQKSLDINWLIPLVSRYLLGMSVPLQSWHPTPLYQTCKIVTLCVLGLLSTIRLNFDSFGFGPLLRSWPETTGDLFVNPRNSVRRTTTQRYKKETSHWRPTTISETVTSCRPLTETHTNTTGPNRGNISLVRLTFSPEESTILLFGFAFGLSVCPLGI